MHTTTRSLITLTLTLLIASCGVDPRSAPAPDASLPPPLDPAGTFELHSSLSISSSSESFAPLLAELTSATDGPDDPSRYLIDLVIARLPEGNARVLADALAPYLSAYLQQRLATFAPRLTASARALADGLARIAHDFDTSATLAIHPDGRTSHTIMTARFDGIDVPFASLGLPDQTAYLEASLVADRLMLTDHTITLAHGTLLRAGLDRAVIPRVVAGATSLDSALAALVDCSALGAHISDYVGLGSPELYAGACSVALARLAAEVYERIAAMPPAPLVLTGVARAVDLNRDGPMDVIADGRWSGSFADVPLAASTFAGSTP